MFGLAQGTEKDFSSYVYNQKFKKNKIKSSKESSATVPCMQLASWDIVGTG